MWCIVGLGNPGSEYARSRHNVGFLVVEELARRLGRRFTRRLRGSVYTEETSKGGPVTLIKPLSFMNESGSPVKDWLEKSGLSPERLLVIHDDLDLAFGRIKVVARGGHGGHQGICSIQEQIGSVAFPRVRVGIGRPDKGKEVEFVLSEFHEAETQVLPELIGRAADAVEEIVANSVASAMNRFNVRTGSGPREEATHHPPEEVRECQNMR
ncbi:MAG: aminoacyl-tRNA hydrolase [Candidatus Methylomirabilales bacterium]